MCPMGRSLHRFIAHRPLPLILRTLGYASAGIRSYVLVFACIRYSLPTNGRNPH